MEVINGYDPSDSPLSSKVAMFNKVADQHNSSQLLNPFSNVRGSSPGRPVFGKDEYGKPLAGSLTEMRGQKANIHVCKEMLELCQIIDSEGFPHPENPDLKVIFFGDLFNIYNHISDKCVGLLLRARKHKLVEFEGEMLFQRRDDEVPIITTKPIKEIRKYIETKTEEFRRSVSPAPKPTTIIQDNMKRATSQTPCSSPLASQAGTPRSLSPASKPELEKINIIKPEPTLRQVHSTPEIKICERTSSENNTSIESTKNFEEIKDKQEKITDVNSVKLEESSISNEKIEESQIKIDENKNNSEKNIELAPAVPVVPAKVVVYLTKPPVVETSIITEEETNVQENNKKNSTTEQVNLENSIEATKDIKEDKEESCNEKKVIEEENIKLENNEIKEEVKIEEPTEDLKIEMPNIVEELNGTSVINNNTKNISSEPEMTSKSEISFSVGDQVTEKSSEQIQNSEQIQDSEQVVNSEQNQTIKTEEQANINPQ